ncbi:MAG: SPFH domain-containing protein [Coriobacteriales bacterium]|jgi:regulator of protease activity HflC (stomatin/prohibitin superfamily)|nr:SPFH domain-containing protein [Coriobacteriales bacterium]
MIVERNVRAGNGWTAIALEVVFLIIALALLVLGVSFDGPLMWLTLFVSVLCFFAILIIAMGFFTLEPNEARVLILFGKYSGTVRTDGFKWANPFYARGNKISLRARTYNGEPLKVNDKNGNPIEIADVVVWRVANTAKAVFDVDNYRKYVQTQSETALRHVATTYAYDHDSNQTAEEITLRSNIEEVSQALKLELATRLEPAGVVIDDARLTHLAYSPEIAQAMLRRQQADAVIAARTRIVYGAVTMVEMALAQLAERHVVDLDDERKATMVSNLLVVLCSESDAQPVVNAGTLYQ